MPNSPERLLSGKTKTKSTGMKKKRVGLVTVAKTTTRMAKLIKSDYLQYSQLPMTNSINKLIKDLPPLSQNCCIYRVPPKVRNLNEKVYAPQVVSIGPFHHGKPNLQAMEEHKLRYLHAFLQRSPGNSSLLEHCETKIREWEKDIRNSYAETFKLTSDQFVEIVLIDSCFVVEAILSYSDPTDTRSFYLPKSNFLYETDMMLLENQLPFFVLDGLYQLAFPDDQPKTNFLKYCIRYFFYRMLIQVDVDKLITKVLQTSSRQILHLVDLLRVCHLPSKLRPLSDKKSDMDLVTMPKVTEIQESGIELKKSSIDKVTIPKVTQIQGSEIELKKSSIDLVTIPKVTQIQESEIKLKKSSIDLVTIPKVAQIQESEIELKKSSIDLVTIPKVIEIQESGIELKKSSIDLVTIPKVTQIQESEIELKKSSIDPKVIEIQESGIEFKKSSIDLVTIPKVTQIQESGIELKKSKSIFPLDIEYTRAVLEIPQVVVDEASEYLLSNILVLEMCHYKEDSYLRDYVFFMDMLIDSPKDVDLLIQSGIVVNWTRDSSAVAHLFNNVGYNFPLVGSKYYFYPVSQDLKKYCRVPRHRWKAAFMRDYCSTPWIIASTTAAVILLLLTFVQTISSVGAI